MNNEQAITPEIRESASSRKHTTIKHTTTATVQDLCHLKKFIQLQQSNMETFPIHSPELWCYLPCFDPNSHWGAQSPCTRVERYTVIPPGCCMDTCPILQWQVWSTPSYCEEFMGRYHDVVTLEAVCCS